MIFRLVIQMRCNLANGCVVVLVIAIIHGLVGGAQHQVRVSEASRAVRAHQKLRMMVHLHVQVANVDVDAHKKLH